MIDINSRELFERVRDSAREARDRQKNAKARGESWVTYGLKRHDELKVLLEDIEKAIESLAVPFPASLPVPKWRCYRMWKTHQANWADRKPEVAEIDDWETMTDTTLYDPDSHSPTWAWVSRPFWMDLDGNVRHTRPSGGITTGTT